MADYRYHLLDLQSYLRLLYSIFFGDLDDLPKPGERRQLWALAGQGIILSMSTVATVGLFLCLSLIDFDWYQAARGVAGGVAFIGVVVGFAGGDTEGAARGVAGGVALGVAFGVAFGVVGGVAGGVVGGVAFGVAVGVAVGFAGGDTEGDTEGAARGVAGGVALGVAFGVAFGVVGGVAGGVAGGVVGGVAFGVAVGVAVGFARGFAVDVAFGVVVGGVFGATVGIVLWSYQETQTLIENPLRAAIADFGVVMIIAVAGFVLSSLVAAMFASVIDRWKPRHQRFEFFGAATILILASVLFGLLLSGLARLLMLETQPSAVLFISIFILIHTRLPLWPLEALWGGLACLRFLRECDLKEGDVDTLARQIRRAYFDRQMILPLPGEVAALRRLSSLDEELAIIEATELTSKSNHRLAAIAALRRFAAQNPIAVQAHLNLDSRQENRERSLNYTAEKLPEASARVWAATQKLHTLGLRLLPPEAGGRDDRPNPLKQAIQLLASAESEDRGSTVAILQELRDIVDDFSAAHSFQSELRHVETHLLLWRALLEALEAESVAAIASFEAPALPDNAPLLYPDGLRNSLARITAIAARARGYVEATSPVTRGRHLLEAQDALEKIEVVIEEVPHPPGPFLALLVAHWRRLFATAGGELARVQETKPFPQPYVIANPVIGAGFAGREDVLRRLEELWAVPGQRPSVVLYGHRRMGKSSILQNLRGERFGPQTRIVDFNLQTYGLVPSTGALLHNLALELYDAFRAAAQAPSDWTEPENAPFDREPFGAFKRFLRQLDRHRGDLRFIVTLDEFETLEERIESGKLQPDLIDYLRGVITTQTWLTLAFAGLHTLREMTEDYWNPLFGSVETIPVTFLNEGATRRLLTVPSEDFAIDYSRGALDFIYALTHGQPYLTQLIGHDLVTRLNDQMFEQQVEREARFGAADVEEVISADTFFRTGGAYFTGIWAQAGQGPPSQQAILQTFASGPASREEILAKTGLGGEEMEAAIEALERHDVIVAENGGAGRWRCTVELMRRWLSRRLQ